MTQCVQAKCKWIIKLWHDICFPAALLDTADKPKEVINNCDQALESWNEVITSVAMLNNTAEFEH